jgi:hypothetical protein
VTGGRYDGGYEEPPRGRALSSRSPIYGSLGVEAAFRVPWDPRIFIACVLHDIGYLSCEEMDGASGKEHVVLGARIMGWLFGRRWAQECYCHSRCWSRRMGLPVSRLCLADKLAFAMTPAWLYIPMTQWTGELAEYMERSRERQAGDCGFTGKEFNRPSPASGCAAFRATRCAGLSGSGLNS